MCLQDYRESLSSSKTKTFRHDADTQDDGGWSTNDKRDLQQYIDELLAENDEIKEETEQLKIENQKLKEQNQKLKEQNQNLEEQNQKLKEQNKILTSRINKRPKQTQVFYE